MVELMSPAGSLRGAELAIENGADALYAGLTSFSMRPRRTEFDRAGFPGLVEYAHRHGKRIYAVLNVYLKPQELDAYRERVDEVYRAGADGIIVGDLSAIQFIHRTYPDLPIHVSIQTSVANAEAARFYEEQGASVVVVSRSMDDLEGLREIREACDVDLEVFVHGGICYMYDGNCYMSGYFKQRWVYDQDLDTRRLIGQNNTKGECQLVCKRTCAMESGDLAVEGNLLRRPDQVGLENLPFYLQLGIRILKIEGRAMPLSYVAEATRLYRQAIDLYFQDPSRFCLQEEWAPVVGRLIQARHDYERTWNLS